MSAGSGSASRRRWQDAAACATRVDLPWLVDGHLVAEGDIAGMRAVCAGCPVVRECLAAVQALGITGGWWAGADRGEVLLPDEPSAVAVESGDGLAWVPVRLGRGTRPGVEQAVIDVGGAA